MGKTLDQIIQMAGRIGSCRVAVAGSADSEVLRAVTEAHKQGLCTPVLVGEPEQTEALLAQLGCKADGYEIIAASDGPQCAARAVELVREGKANLLMKGMINTSDMMRAVISHETGIRTSHLISHVMLYQVSTYPKVLAVTDGGMIPCPTLEQKKGILENAAALFQLLGYTSINASCICGSEVMNPKITAMTDAATLAGMKELWKKWNMNVIGPVGLDLAISRESCDHKSYSEPGCGDADILLVPAYEVGNALGKSMTYFAGARNAGVVLGAACPIVLVSRSDAADSKLASIALGAIASGMKYNFDEGENS